MRAMIAMRPIPRLLVVCLCLAGCAVAADIQVHFAPGKDCTAEAVRQIDAGKKSVYVQAYYFTSKPIADALVRAKKRGLDVRICLDAKASQQKGCRADDCVSAGIPVFADEKHPISHSKTIVLDGRIVLTGSFNWTKHAESNLENLLTIADEGLAAKYVANWREHQAHCQPWKPKETRP